MAETQTDEQRDAEIRKQLRQQLAIARHKARKSGRARTAPRAGS